MADRQGRRTPPPTPAPVQIADLAEKVALLEAVDATLTRVRRDNQLLADTQGDVKGALALVAELHGMQGQHEALAARIAEGTDQLAALDATIGERRQEVRMLDDMTQGRVSSKAQLEEDIATLEKQREEAKGLVADSELVSQEHRQLNKLRDTALAEFAEQEERHKRAMAKMAAEQDELRQEIEAMQARIGAFLNA